MTKEELMEIQDRVRNPLAIIVGFNSMSKADLEIKEKIIEQVNRINTFIKELELRYEAESPNNQNREESLD